MSSAWQTEQTATLTPEAPSSLATFSPAGRERDVRMTRAPAVASARTVSTPMPELDPVTTAVLPAQRQTKRVIGPALLSFA